MRWLRWTVDQPRAGALGNAEIELENAGSATWRSAAGEGIHLAYHWLDERGNPIVWDGLWTPFEHTVAPGQRIRREMAVRAPIPPGRYRLAIDLVDGGRLWFAEAGNQPLELELVVQPRIERRLAVRGGDPDALAAQEEPLVDEEHAAATAFLAPESAPAPDWSRRVLDAHQEGYAVVGGSVDAALGLLRRPPRELAPWAPGSGRVPGFPHALLCPSVVAGIEAEWVDDVVGLPAARAPADEPFLYDGRIRVTARPRRGRRGV